MKLEVNRLCIKRSLVHLGPGPDFEFLFLVGLGFRASIAAEDDDSAHTSTSTMSGNNNNGTSNSGGGRGRGTGGASPFQFILLDGLFNGAEGGEGIPAGFPFNMFFGGGMPRQQSRPQVDNSGVGHLYDASMPPREWIQREQRRRDGDALLGIGNEGSGDGQSTNSQLSEAARERGNRAFSDGRLDDALSYYNEAIRLKPNCEKSYANRSLVHQRAGRFEAAAADAEKAIEIAPTYFKGHFRLANAQFSLGHYEAAEASCKKCEEFVTSEEDREQVRKLLQKCDSKRVRAPPQPPGTPPQSPTAVSGNAEFPRVAPDTPLTPLSPSMFAVSDSNIEFCNEAFSTLKSRRQKLRAAVEQAEVVDLADRFTKSRCGKELRQLLNEIDPDLLAAAQYAATTSQEELRKATEAGDRTAFENALKLRDEAFAAVWHKARLGVRAIERAKRLAHEDVEGMAALAEAVDKLPPLTPEDARRLKEESQRPSGGEAPQQNGGEQTSQKDEPTTLASQRSSSWIEDVSGLDVKELSDKVGKYRQLRKTIHAAVQPAVAKVDEALQALAQAQAEEARVFDDVAEQFNELRSTAQQIRQLLQQIQATTKPSCASSKERLETLDQLRPNLESILDDEITFQRHSAEGNALLEEEAQLERDRLKWEKHRIQSQAELEWAKVREELPNRLENHQREVELAVSRLSNIVQRQSDVRARLLKLIESDHPELAWKAAAAGSRLMKAVKGSGLWVNENFSDFQVQSIVASTAGAKVYHATSRKRGFDVALKEIPIESDADKKRFLTEVSVSVAAEGHSGICNPLGVFFDGPFGYIIMPYYSKGNAKKFLEKGPAWPWWKVQEIFRQIVTGLAYLHDKGIMHHDVKPSNLLMKDENHVLLSDFGLSRDLGRFGNKKEITVTMMRGTPEYTAPELLSAKEGESVSAMRADLWSLGATLYVLATINAKLQDPDADEPPTLSDLLSQEGKIVVRPQFVGGSERLADLLTALLSRDPAERPPIQQVLAHPYFTVSLLKDLVDNHQLIESNQKLEAFRTYVHEVTQHTHRRPMMMSVVRPQMVESVTSILRQLPDESSILAPFFVVFRGEEGIDEGGLTQEMFNLYYQQLVTKQRALVSSASSGDDSDSVDADGGYNTSVHYLPSGDPNIPESVFKALGMMMLKSVIENRPMQIQLSPAVLKYLVGGTPGLTDLEEYDRVMVRNLRRLLLMDDEDLATMALDFSEFDETFLAKYDNGKYKQTTEVTRENVAVYVNCKVYYELIGKRERALKAIKEGFSTSSALQPHLQLLSSVELQLLLCGQQHLNAEDVIMLLEFAQFPAESQTPQMLKELIRSFSQANLRRFLRLCTSAVTLPQASTSSSRAPKIKVLCTSDTRRLPVGHSCAFQLDMPDYNDAALLREKLGTALAHANDGFNIV